VRESHGSITVWGDLQGMVMPQSNHWIAGSQLAIASIDAVVAKSLSLIRSDVSTVSDAVCETSPDLLSLVQ
jgi:hypothetical protein